MRQKYEIVAMLCCLAAAQWVPLAAQDTVTEVIVNPTTTLKVFMGASTYTPSKNRCSAMGGGPASFAAAPDELKQLACDHGEIFVLDNSQGDHEVVLDQSSAGTSENPARSTVICDGFCQGCGVESEEKPFACCVGSGCTDFPGSERDWSEEVIVNPTTTLKIFMVASTYTVSKDSCSALGGGPASFAAAPDELKQLACDHGEIFVLDNSQGDHEVVLDQSFAGTSANPARSTVICDGFCQGCAVESEEKPFACCVGSGCADFPGSVRDWGSAGASGGAGAISVSYSLPALLLASSALLIQH